MWSSMSTTAESMAETPLRAPSPKERETYEWYHDFVREFGYVPTMREAAKALGVSPTMVRARLEALARKGYVRRMKGLSRALAFVTTLPAKEA
jgi:SOS-response transcriptional repressor LexA